MSDQDYGDAVSGILRTKHVELPFEDKAKQQEANDMNRQLAGFGVRVVRSATDWGYSSHDNSLTSRFLDSGTYPDEHVEATSFKAGDLVKIFKTVTDGDIAWQGKIDYDRSEYHHGFQKDIDKKDWSRMFSDALPAKLERKDGTVIYGALEPFCETGTEGVIWSVSEYGQAGYAGLNCLEEGDVLTVYKNVRDGEVEWEGVLDFEEENITKVGWTEVLRETKHMKTEDWLQMSWDNRPVVVKPKI